MKKFLSLITVLTVIFLTLTGCANRFNWKKNVEKLKEQGLIVSNICTEDEQLDEATALTNTEIEFMGGDFTVKITNFISFVKDGDYARNCQIFEFADKDQAESYAELYIATRGETSQFKVGVKGRVVVVTNLEEAWQTLGMEFK